MRCSLLFVPIVLAVCAIAPMRTHAQVCPPGYELQANMCIPRAVSAAPPILYARVALGAGVGTYQYPTSGRNALGLMIDVMGTLAYRLPGDLIVGGTLSFDPLFAASGSGSNGAFSTPFAPALFIGPTIGYAGQIFRFEGSLGFIAGGMPFTGPPAYGAGGYGLGISTLGALRVYQLEGMALDVQLRPLLGFLSDWGTGKFAVSFSCTAGAALVF